ncbi:ankyrin repeat domain-containing protein [Wukongibacter sp. M2B1]|uniref:ankyrin repeat domain-containing protein n=1 Tax=Wukongibacter sp. M2B1 TaxID=3088895 RepID=UPI003D7BA0B5
MGKRMIIMISISAVIISMIAYSYHLISRRIDDGEYEINNVKIYKDTPVWTLALSVREQKISSIEKIVKEKPELLNYQEPKYGATLLLWAIGMEKYESAEILLKCGADPDIATTKYGETPLFLAAGYSWLDNDAKKDSKYVELLLNYGADPDKSYIGSDIPGDRTIIEPGSSPLMHSIGAGIKKTKALVEAGADINYKTKSGNTPARVALLYDQNTDYAYYLIAEKKAKVTDPYYRRRTYSNQDPNEEFYPVNILRNWVFDLDSREYKIKMEIIEEFTRQGVDYWDTPINKSTLEHIKKLYPQTWEEYIKKY